MVIDASSASESEEDDDLVEVVVVAATPSVTHVIPPTTTTTSTTSSSSASTTTSFSSSSTTTSSATTTTTTLGQNSTDIVIVATDGANQSSDKTTAIDTKQQRHHHQQHQQQQQQQQPTMSATFLENDSDSEDNNGEVVDADAMVDDDAITAHAQSQPPHVKYERIECEGTMNNDQTNDQTNYHNNNDQTNTSQSNDKRNERLNKNDQIAAVATNEDQDNDRNNDLPMLTTTPTVTSTTPSSPEPVHVTIAPPIAVEIAPGMLASEMRNANAVADARDSLTKQQHDLDTEVKRAAAASAGLSPEVIAECQHLIELFGLPYVVAPMEAEAQCAQLELDGVTSGTITDDSDIFLFGGQTVYRRVCSTHKSAELYQRTNIQRILGLDRDKLIRLAFLLGCDYTVGIKGIGIVTAMEVLAEFPGAEGLENFRDWVHNPNSNEFGVRRAVKSLKKATLISDDFPDPRVFEAFVAPQVLHKLSGFEWEKPDYDALRQLAIQRFNWGADRTEQMLAPLLNRPSWQPQQKITTFFTAQPQTEQQPIALNKQIATLGRSRLKSAVASSQRSNNTKDPKRRKIERSKTPAPVVEPPMDVQYDLATLRQREVECKRSPAMVLFAAIVAQKSFPTDWESALTIGRAMADWFAIQKADYHGIRKKKDSGASTDPLAFTFKLFGVSVNVIRVDKAKGNAPSSSALIKVRALDWNNHRRIEPAGVWGYVKKSLGPDFDVLRQALRSLVSSIDMEDLKGDNVLYGMWERFRPTVAHGTKGWGKVGVLQLAKILDERNGYLKSKNRLL